MSNGATLRGAIAAVGVGAVIVLALVVILTALRTELPRSPGLMSDALGPESGEAVAGYLERASASLAGGAVEAGPRWALVTAERPWSVAEAADVVAALPRVSMLYVQVPVPGVAMPVAEETLAEPVAGEADREPVFVRALERLAGAAVAVDGRGRVAETEALTVARVQAGEPAIIGLTVRGDTEALRMVADEPGVRAVEALPADAVWGRFAVRPLQPQQLEAAEPLPDHAPVPPA